MLLSAYQRGTILDVLKDISGKLYGNLSQCLLSFTFLRLILAASLLPVYMIKKTFVILPTVVSNLNLLLAASGRSRLVRDAERYREEEQSMAELQFEGKYRFPKEKIFRISKDEEKGWMNDRQFSTETKEMSVCGVTARYVHLRPDITTTGISENKRPLVFLHGNPSWIFIWRNVLPHLAKRRHEVYALDWIGHGRSDKVTDPSAITFELHMKTLIQFFELTSLENAIIVAHDWGGCIALCTFPFLPPTSCHGIFLLNSFFPPRSNEISMHYILLYIIWFLSTGIVGGYLPEAGVMRYMCPNLPQTEIEGYSAPYNGLPVSTKASIFRFGHMVPGFPRILLLRARYTRIWKMVEGLCGPVHFSSLNAQARLAERDIGLRQFWMRGSDTAGNDAQRVAVVFGEDDPLLKSYKDIIVRTIHARFRVDWAPNGIWLPDAGHYPMEEKPREIAELVEKFSNT